MIERQAAIDLIERMKPYQLDGEDCQEIIHNMPPAELATNLQQTCNLASNCISRQEAIDAHYEYCNKHPDAGFPVWSLKILENLPSAQPEIVRCKDCKHYDGRPCGKVDWYNSADDFCSRAERREDG